VPEAWPSLKLDLSPEKRGSVRRDRAARGSTPSVKPITFGGDHALTGDLSLPSPTRTERLTQERVAAAGDREPKIVLGGG